jgi:hypothetical protein
MLVIIIASYYVLFALMAGWLQPLVVESVVMSAFVLGAVSATGECRLSHKWLRASAGHHPQDLTHQAVSSNGKLLYTRAAVNHFPSHGDRAFDSRGQRH